MGTVVTGREDVTIQQTTCSDIGQLCKFIGLCRDQIGGLTVKEMDF